MKSGCVSSFSTLTMIMIVLKLANVIDWSWWIILLPAMVEFGVVFLAAAFKVFIEKPKTPEQKLMDLLREAGEK